MTSIKQIFSTFSIYQEESLYMNIFYLSNNPEKAAQMHCDKHVVKMIVEYCQLLSTSHRLLDGYPYRGLSDQSITTTHWQLNDEREDMLYKATHVAHPSSIWTRQNSEHYKWLYTLLCCLLEEYKWRYKKPQHACERLLPYLALLPHGMPEGCFTPPTPVMQPHYVIPGDSVTSYRKYYMEVKSGFATWKRREKPFWWL